MNAWGILPWENFWMMIPKPQKYVNGFWVTLLIINDLVSQIQSSFSSHKKLTNTVLLISLLRPESERRSVMSHSLQAHGLYPWNSPGQNTGVGSLSLLQGIFPSQGSNPGLLHCGRILYQLSHRGSPIRPILYFSSLCTEVLRQKAVSSRNTLFKTFKTSKQPHGRFNKWHLWHKLDCETPADQK